MSDRDKRQIRRSLLKKKNMIDNKETIKRRGQNCTSLSRSNSFPSRVCLLVGNEDKEAETENDNGKSFRVIKVRR